MPPQTRSTTQRTTESGSSVVQRARSKVACKRATRVPSGKPKPEPGREPERPHKRPRLASVEIEDISPVGIKEPSWGTQIEGLTNLPVELLMQIAKYLRPLELLLLSRVNKSLRIVLMSRSASSAWRSAQLNLPGLPPCPSSLCEPQYAALLFLRECSTCGRTTSYDVDFPLLVRLCVVCRRQQAVDTHRLEVSGVVFTSKSLMRGKKAHKWCLIDDVIAAKERLTELSGDSDATDLWITNRHEDIRQREKVALALSEWTEEQDMIREAELDSIKDKRQRDIESRLLDLGWERQDFYSNLTWSQLLPDLLRILKQNRTARLKVEMEVRRDRRAAAIKTWFRDTREEIGLFAKAIPHGDSSGPVHAGSFRWSMAKTTRMLSLQALPSADNFNQLSHLKSLAEIDISVDELKVQLNEQREEFMESVTEWQNKLENALLEVLPANTLAPSYDETSGFSLMGMGRCMQPFSDLPANLRKLLRADSTFTSRSGGISFYPDGYAEWTPAKSPVKYHEKASNVAKGLLNALDRPDASYLELKALGAAFRCGVCHARPTCMTWESLIQHYLDQEARWRLNSRPFDLPGNDIPFVCTHDVDRTNSAKPLVYIVEGSDKDNGDPYIHKFGRCALCARIGTSELLDSDYIADHVRDVHLIDEPTQGTHYQLFQRAY